MDALLQSLAASLDGHLRSRGVDGESPTVPAWNSLLKGPTSPVLHVAQPLAVVECAGKQDVVKALRFAVEHKLKLAARGPPGVAGMLLWALLNVAQRGSELVIGSCHAMAQ